MADNEWTTWQTPDGRRLTVEVAERYTAQGGRKLALVRCPGESGWTVIDETELGN